MSKISGKELSDVATSIAIFLFANVLSKGWGLKQFNREKKTYERIIIDVIEWKIWRNTYSIKENTRKQNSNFHDFKWSSIQTIVTKRPELEGSAVEDSQM